MFLLNNTPFSELKYLFSLATVMFFKLSEEKFKNAQSPIISTLAGIDIFPKLSISRRALSATSLVPSFIVKLPFISLSAPIKQLPI